MTEEGFLTTSEWFRSGAEENVPSCAVKYFCLNLFQEYAWNLALFREPPIRKGASHGQRKGFGSLPQKGWNTGPWEESDT